MGEKRKWTPEEVRQWYSDRKTRNYSNPEDTNWVVRKPHGLGWAMNLANPKIWWFLAGVACVVMLVTWVTSWRGSIGIIGGADGPTAIYVSGGSGTPTGYPAGSVQRPHVMYDGILYMYSANGFDVPLPEGFALVGSVQCVDDANAPTRDFAGSLVEVGQKIYASPENSSIYVEYTDGFGEFVPEETK